VATKYVTHCLQEVYRAQPSAIILTALTSDCGNFRYSYESRPKKLRRNEIEMQLALFILINVLPCFTPALDLHCVLRRPATSSCRRPVDESATRLSLSPHHEHGTGCRHSSCCCGRSRLFVANWKHFCSILPGNRLTNCFVMRYRSSVGGARQMTQLQLLL